ncbi:MAG TPA: serine hydrolase [Clostridiales bacterium UBA8153]|nr:serine hydrolase [Clostridiales bacterium UBA8153]
MKNRDWQAFADYALGVMTENHIAGAAVAVSRHGKIDYAQGFGLRDIASGLEVTPETVFGIASVSKSFTAMGITQLADRGLLAIDDPVVKCLPEFRLVGAGDMEAIKIRHLLSHTTGVPPMRRRQDINSFDDHVRFLATEEYELLGLPSEYFSYCNDAFLLNGLIIQRLTGQLYRRYMTRYLLDAMDMHRSTYSLEEVGKLDQVSTPYNYNRKTGQLEAQPWPVLGTYEVGGGIRSNVLDLLKYGEVYLRGGLTCNGTRIVSEAGIRRMYQPVYQTGRRTHYALGLHVTPDYAGQGLTLVEHGGGQPGVSSNFGFIPEAGVAVAVLTNVQGVPAGAIWLAAANTALGLALSQKRNVEVAWDAPREHLAKFPGVFRSAEGGRIQVELVDSGLVVKLEELEFPLVPSDERTFFFEAQGQQQVVKFYFDQGGKPWAALAHSRMLRKAAG